MPSRLGIICRSGLADHTLSKAQLAVGSDRRIHHGINKARDAIFMASERNQKCGILDNDYKAAFDYMVLKWVFKVLLAKGMDEEVVNRLYNLYNNHLTVVVVNGVQGRCFLNTRWSIRQGDRPSSTFGSLAPGKAGNSCHCLKEVTA